MESAQWRATMHTDRKHVFNPLGNKVSIHPRKLEQSEVSGENTNALAAVNQLNADHAVASKTP